MVPMGQAYGVCECARPCLAVGAKKEVVHGSEKQQNVANCQMFEFSAQALHAGVAGCSNRDTGSEWHQSDVHTLRLSALECVRLSVRRKE